MKTKLIIVTIAAFIGATSSFAHSESIKPDFVDMLLTSYFELQAALSKDDLASSKADAKTFMEMLGHGPSREEAASLADLSKEADKIINASDIKIVRTAFLAISKDLARMVEHVGTTGKSDVVKMYCPMAFNNKGGSWLQNNHKPANPYYGSMMYSCGSVQETLATAKGGKAPQEHGEHAHGNHNRSQLLL